DRYLMDVFVLTCLYGTMAVAWNLAAGFTGLLSLGHSLFIGIGAYAAAIITTQGWPLVAALVVAVALCFVVGWLLGYPALRVQHHYLAFVTLAFSTLAYLVFRNEEWLTKGIYGITGVPRPTLFG
ncbi:branched-chain amino acid ABC transporter permease, partial [Enterococcus faecium]|uniref:branched-chain amino acid ABC transporter permease n=1 Tax=Enterococcus faecium TaxID=1352 RepID=UPI003AAE1D50